MVADPVGDGAGRCGIGNRGVKGQSLPAELASLTDGIFPSEAERAMADALVNRTPANVTGSLAVSHPACAMAALAVSWLCTVVLGWAICQKLPTQ